MRVDFAQISGDMKEQGDLVFTPGPAIRRLLFSLLEQLASHTKGSGGLIRGEGPRFELGGGLWGEVQPLRIGISPHRIMSKYSDHGHL